MSGVLSLLDYVTAHLISFSVPHFELHFPDGPNPRTRPADQQASASNLLYAHSITSMFLYACGPSFGPHL